MTPSVLLVGKPNSGKSLLFNRLTGLKQKVSNFPGATVEVRSGTSNGITFIDHPGIYSLNSLTSDEEIAIRELKNSVEQDQVRAVVCVLDITRLEQSLALGLRVKQLVNIAHKPILFVLNMIDELGARQTMPPLGDLQSALGCGVVPVSAKTQEGIANLKQTLHDMLMAKDLTKGQALPMINAADLEITDAYAQANRLAKPFREKTRHLLKRQNALDRFFLNSWIGALLFLAVMAVLFQAIFTWATPLMNAIEIAVSYLSSITTQFVPAGIIHDFVEDAIFNGVGSFLVFVPQIFVLTFIIGLLEDSGYLARAAIICHRPLSLFGLTGKSFVPYLSGHACAIPAILAARTIESPRRRLVTILTIPLIACSARLPVYSLLIAALIPPVYLLGNILGLQGLVFFGLYVFGIVMALIVSSVLSKTYFRNETDLPFILELPPYRLPHWTPLVHRSLSSAWAFISNAGWIILLVTVAVWFLGYFPNGQGQLHTSWLAQLGKWFEPVFQSLGLDWKFGVAILSSFIAREVFVGTLGTLYGMEGAGDNIVGLASKIQNSNITLASGLALLAFYAIALQCVSTVAVIKKETGKAWWGIAAIVIYGLIAYILAWIIFNSITFFHAL